MYISKGRDLHPIRKLENGESLDKVFRIGGVHITGYVIDEAKSDGDVIYHALTDALSGIGFHPYNGNFYEHVETMLKHPITNSKDWVLSAKQRFDRQNVKLVSVALQFTGKYPRIDPIRELIIKNVSGVLTINPENTSLSASSGNNVGEVGRGEAVEALVDILYQKNGRTI